MSGADEFFELANDFAQASAKTAVTLFETFKQGGDEFAEAWADNARATAGEHGKHYPDSITSETRVALGILVQTGPEAGRKQGRMGRGFEFGSKNQDPHLDGLRALAPADVKLTRLADNAVRGIVP